MSCFAADDRHHNWAREFAPSFGLHVIHRIISFERVSELPSLFVPPPGIEPGFREWKSRVLTFRRQGHFEAPAGLEPATWWLTAICSTYWATEPYLWKQKDSNLRTPKRAILQTAAVAAWLCFLIVKQTGLEPVTSLPTKALFRIELLFVRPLRNWCVSQRLSTIDAPKTSFQP